MLKEGNKIPLLSEDGINYKVIGQEPKVRMRKLDTDGGNWTCHGGQAKQEHQSINSMKDRL